MKRFLIASACLILALAPAALRAQHHGNSNNSSSSSQQKAGKDLVDIAASRSDLSTLVAAVKAAGLVETLQGKGPYTVFAPTNTAFAALPEGTVASLLKPENKAELVKILTYHVVPGRVEANDLSSGKIASVQGGRISVSVSSGAVRINDALVVSADNRALNGVVHIIDRVILPPND
jgi:uncharacterized surface protein with fasciclin (FAS1) repeats